MPPASVSQASSNSAQTATVQSVATSQAESALDSLASRLRFSNEQLVFWHQFESRVHTWEQYLYKEQPVWSADANVVAEMARLTLNQQNRLTLMEDLEASIKSLYAVLTPDQQQTINPSLLQVIPGLLPVARRDSTNTTASLRDSGRFGTAGSGRRRAGGMGGLGGMN